MEKISICIPTWEQYGKGKFFLKKLFDTIVTQTYKNFNVIISDHSQDFEIKNLCDEYKKKFDIIYFKNEDKRGNSPSNTNKSITLADGQIIKIVFQDDFFFDSTALEQIHESFIHKKCKWLVSGCNHTSDDGNTFYNTMIPCWNDGIIYGANTISSPSVLSFQKNCGLEFDENLVLLMDCDFYFALYKKFGLPYIIDNCLMTQRSHELQISQLYDYNNKNSEINYVKKKYSI